MSLRRVARALGMASSALYRYFPSRDELLTALIVDAYDAVGTAAEQADAACEPTDRLGRFRAVCRAVRHWALEHPAEYALIYGSPVPGYRAPFDTVGPATRVGAVLGRLLDATSPAELGAGPGPLPPALSEELLGLSRSLGSAVPAEVMLRGLIVWSSLFGSISFELFGHFHNVVEDLDAYFEEVIDRLAGFAGLVAR